MRLFDALKGQLEVWKFQRSPLGMALQQHTQDYFHSGQVLSWLKQENKEKIAQVFMLQLVAIRSSQDIGYALREKLAEYVLLYCQLSLLCLTEKEKAQHMFAGNPYISGELHHHIEAAASHNEEMASTISQSDGDFDHEDLIATANTRSTIALYYANGLNMARIAIGDTDPDKDWYRPFVEAMAVWEEDQLRNKLDLKRLVPGPIGALPYASFLDHVLAGERNPFFTWTREWPDLYLAGEGPAPEVATA
jgi:hypothetical protein